MVRWGLCEDAGMAEVAALFGILLREYVPLDAAWHIDGVGAAAWLPPTAAAVSQELDERTRDAIRPLTPDEGRAYGRFWEWIDAHLPEEDVWLLDVLGVDPTVQGRGLGRLLVQHGLDVATAAHLPAYLETGNPRNVAYYEQLGFRVVADADPPDGGPHVWFLRHG